MKRAFTLVELLVVIAIMGLLGTVSVAGYQAMQRGMEERAVMDNVDRFLQAGFERAQIDRVPVALYFWNETLTDENEDSSGLGTLTVVGKGVAVRRAGRITDVVGDKLYDEFGDLRFLSVDYEDEDSEEQRNSNSESDFGSYLYPMNGSSDGNSVKRSLVSQNTVRGSANEPLLQGSGENVEIPGYAYVVLDAGGVTWQRGWGYGFEFAEIQLPKNFIFGSAYSRDTSNPVAEGSATKISFKPGRVSSSGTITGGTDGSASIQIYALRPDDSGELKPQSVGTVSYSGSGSSSR